MKLHTYASVLLPECRFAAFFLPPNYCSNIHRHVTLGIVIEMQNYICHKVAVLMTLPSPSSNTMSRAVWEMYSQRRIWNTVKLGLQLKGLQAPKKGRGDIKAKAQKGAGQLETDAPTRKVCGTRVVLCWPRSSWTASDGAVSEPRGRLLNWPLSRGGSPWWCTHHPEPLQRCLRGPPT